MFQPSLIYFADSKAVLMQRSSVREEWRIAQLSAHEAVCTCAPCNNATLAAMSTACGQAAWAFLLHRRAHEPCQNAVAMSTRTPALSV